MLTLGSETVGTDFGELPPRGRVCCHVPRCPLPTGQYLINLFCDRAGQPVDWVERATELTVVQGDFYGTGREVPTSHATIYVDYSWARDRQADAVGSGPDTGEEELIVP